MSEQYDRHGPDPEGGTTRPVFEVGAHDADTEMEYSDEGDPSDDDQMFIDRQPRAGPVGIKGKMFWPGQHIPEVSGQIAESERSLAASLGMFLGQQQAGVAAKTGLSEPQSANYPIGMESPSSRSETHSLADNESGLAHESGGGDGLVSRGESPERGDAKGKGTRRGSKEHVRTIPCTQPGCTRAYSTDNSLRNHIRLKHSFRGKTRMKKDGTKDGLEQLQPAPPARLAPSIPGSVPNHQFSGAMVTGIGEQPINRTVSCPTLAMMGPPHRQMQTHTHTPASILAQSTIADPILANHRLANLLNTSAQQIISNNFESKPFPERQQLALQYLQQAMHSPHRQTHVVIQVDINSPVQALVPLAVPVQYLEMFLNPPAPPPPPPPPAPANIPTAKVLPSKKQATKQQLLQLQLMQQHLDQVEMAQPQIEQGRQTEHTTTTQMQQSAGEGPQSGPKPMETTRQQQRTSDTLQSHGEPSDTGTHMYGSEQHPSKATQFSETTPKSDWSLQAPTPVHSETTSWERNSSLGSPMTVATTAANFELSLQQQHSGGNPTPEIQLQQQQQQGVSSAEVQSKPEFTPATPQQPPPSQQSDAQQQQQQTQQQQQQGPGGKMVRRRRTTASLRLQPKSEPADPSSFSSGNMTPTIGSNAQNPDSKKSLASSLSEPLTQAPPVSAARRLQSTPAEPMVSPLARVSMQPLAIQPTPYVQAPVVTLQPREAVQVLHAPPSGAPGHAGNMQVSYQQVSVLQPPQQFAQVQAVQQIDTQRHPVHVHPSQQQHAQMITRQSQVMSVPLSGSASTPSPGNIALVPQPLGPGHVMQLAPTQYGFANSDPQANGSGQSLHQQLSAAAAAGLQEQKMQIMQQHQQQQQQIHVIHHAQPIQHAPHVQFQAVAGAGGTYMIATQPPQTHPQHHHHHQQQQQQHVMGRTAAAAGVSPGEGYQQIIVQNGQQYVVTGAQPTVQTQQVVDHHGNIIHVIGNQSHDQTSGGVQTLHLSGGVTATGATMAPDGSIQLQIQQPSGQVQYVRIPAGTQIVQYSQSQPPQTITIHPSQPQPPPPPPPPPQHLPGGISAGGQPDASLSMQFHIGNQQPLRIVPRQQVNLPIQVGAHTPAALHPRPQPPPAQLQQQRSAQPVFSTAHSPMLHPVVGGVPTGPPGEQILSGQQVGPEQMLIQHGAAVTQQMGMGGQGVGLTQDLYDEIRQIVQDFDMPM